MVPPHVETEIPGPQARRVLEEQARVESEARTYPKQIPLVPKKCKGSQVTDVDDNVFIELFGGLGTAPVGYSHPEVLKAVRDTNAFLNQTLDFPTELRVQFMNKLSEIVPIDNPRFNFGGPGGSAAVEATIKLARSVGSDHGKSGHGMIAFQGSFHGETFGAFSLTADRRVKQRFGPQLPEVKHLAYPTNEYQTEHVLETIKEMFTGFYGGLSDPIGIWLEPIQAESGVRIPTMEFVKGIRELCTDHDVLMILDEIQSGFGRTGEWFGIDHYNVEPDVMTLGKAVGGGLPLSCVVYKDEVEPGYTAWNTGTFRGNNPGFAAGSATIDVIQEEGLVGRSRDLGEVNRQHLHADVQSEDVVDIRGEGLLTAIEFEDRATRDAVRERVFQEGIITWGGGMDEDVIRVMPALNIPDAQLETGTEKLIEVTNGVA